MAKEIIEMEPFDAELALAKREVYAYFCLDDLICESPYFVHIKTYAPGTLKRDKLQEELDAIRSEGDASLKQIRSEYFIIDIRIGYFDENTDFCQFASKRVRF